MNDPLKKMKVRFSSTQQERSQKTLQDLLQAAESIVETGDADQFDARTLSKLSGYSLGSLVKRLGKIENIFLHIIAQGRTREIGKIAQQLNELDTTIEPRQLVEKFSDLAFNAIEKVNPSVIRYYEKRATIRADSLATVYAYIEEIVSPLLNLMEINQSGLYRKLDVVEARYICRSIFLFIERPYVEGDPIAGSERHKQIVVENITRLLIAEK
jgi:hypothetical protein